MDWKLFNDELPLQTCGILLLSDCENADALPFICTLLQQRLRDTNAATLLFSMDRPASDYFEIGRRMGSDPTLAAVRGKFIAVDAFTGNPASAGVIGCNLLQTTFDEVLNTIKTAGAKLKGGLTIVLSGLGVLLALGWSLSQVCRLIIGIESAFPGVSLIIKVARGSGETLLLQRWINHRAVNTIILRPLSVGPTAEAHGELRFFYGDLASPDIRKEQMKGCWLFRSSDAQLLMKKKSHSSNDSIVSSLQ